LPTESGGEGPVIVSATDYAWFVDRALEKMAEIVAQLGDELSLRRPPFRDANSPFGILSHCLGVVEFWGGAAVAGRPVGVERTARFDSVGRVSDLVRRTEHARRRLREDLVGLDSAAPLADAASAATARPELPAVPYGELKGAALVHVLEELFEHLGQMEVTRDALVSGLRR
jgi:hypothetical protein